MNGGSEKFAAIVLTKISNEIMKEMLIYSLKKNVYKISELKKNTHEKITNKMKKKAF